MVQNQLLQTFQLNPKNFKCLETVSTLVKLLGSQSPQIRDEISASINELCLMILPKTMKAQLKPDQEDSFANRCDIDVVTQFATLLYTLVNLNAQAFLVGSSFDQCI